jgi:hypothetical protein
MTFQATLTNSTSERTSGGSSETSVEPHRPGGPGNRLLPTITRSFNTQLLTKFGYYLSPKPTIQQLKK